MGLSIRILQIGTPEYRAAVQLRREVLRWPLGLEFSAEDLARDADEVMISLWQGALILGVLQMVPLPGGVSKMRQVAVESMVQGRGLGRRLVEAAEDWARSSGHPHIELNARDSAIPFYLALGYTVVGDGFSEVGIPHHKMVRDV